MIKQKSNCAAGASMGKIIAIEGLDGSGKTTQAQKLWERALKNEKKLQRIKFPNYEEDSSALVKLYLNGQLGELGAVNAYAASSFYSMDRYATYLRHMKKNYEAGDTFLLDRYTTANMVHQATKEPENNRDAFLDWLQDFEYKKLELPKPDLVIFLDIDPEVSSEMLSKRYLGDESKKDIHESNLVYQKECRKAALYAAKKFGWIVVPCSEGKRPLPVEQIADYVWDAARFLILGET